MHAHSQLMFVYAFVLLVLSVDGQAIKVHVHLYETAANMFENKGGGGVWHPDELARFLKKIKQYLNLLLRNSDIFFSRVQIWSEPLSVYALQLAANVVFYGGCSLAR